MKIIDLLNVYKEELKNTPDIDTIFAESGMVKDFPEFEHGFFPLGSGIFVEGESAFDVAKIEKCKIMVLGNDFGTTKYIEEECPDNKEKPTNATINNLSKLPFNKSQTFYTNFYMGLRDSKNGATNTKRSVSLKIHYKYFNFLFFKKQIELLQPKLVISLGREVGKTLSEISCVFTDFNLKSSTFEKLYSDDKFRISTNENFMFGKRDFILIPHPSYAANNWKNEKMMEKIKTTIEQYL